jgi:hypothetical protein
MSNDTQFLPLEIIEKIASMEEQERRGWEDMQALRPVHIHGPFTFLLNQNHNALRGCQSCGQTWVGVMAGDPNDIRWHSVNEPPDEEE